MKSIQLVALSVIILAILIGIYFYPYLPDKFASHWNASGEVNGYMTKFWGLFLMPIISLGLFLFFMLILRIDPLRKNIEKFKNYFEGFLLVLIIFLFYLYILTIFWNLGLRFVFTALLMPAFATLSYCIGVLISHSKQNWFVGIRTPWTLSNAKVWEETHKLGGRLFKISSFVILLGIIFLNYAIFFILIPLFLSAMIVVVYSYIIYTHIKP